MTEDLTKKLENINKRLAEVTAERKKLSPIKQIKYKNKIQKKKSSSSSSNKLCHPYLNSVITEISLSPYLTKPDQKYSKKTIQLPSIIRDLRENSVNNSTHSTHSNNLNQSSSNLSSSLSTSTSSISINTSILSINEKEMNQFKKTFQNVLHYKTQYNPPLRKKLPSLNHPPPSSTSSSQTKPESQSQLPSTAASESNPISTSPDDENYIEE